MSRLREAIVPACIALGFRLFAYAVVLSQYLSSSCYDYLSRVCGLPPCGVFRVQDSAIVIVGGEGELGRSIALNFSESGYTVFTLHPTQQQVAVGELSTQSADTSSATLLYAWHKRKERSDHPWGLVAPIALDMTSAADRKRASETIRAYCATHSLQLVALISLSPPAHSPGSSDTASSQNTASTPASKAQLKRRATKDFSQALIWGDMVAQSVREPIVMFQDYIDMLARVSGRIIMLSTCSDTVSSHLFPLSSAFDGIQRSVAQYLGQQLDFYGIKLCTVATGPVQDHDDGQLSDSSAVNNGSWRTLLRILRRILKTLDRYPHFKSSRLRDPLAVTQDDISYLLREIVAAEYPKDSFCLGIQPYLSRVSQVIPTPLRLLTNSLTR